MKKFTYKNPITTDRAQSLRDYQIVKVANTWYMTGTSHPIWEGPNPGVKLFISKDLLHWEFHSLIVDASLLPDSCFYKGRFWAPEIHLAHGQFYLTVSSGNSGHVRPEYEHKHGVVLFAADAITGPYQLVTKNDSLGQGFKNDASMFTDDDGRSYIYCSGGGLWQAEIDLREGKLIGGDDFQRFCSPGDEGLPEWMTGGIEGPFVIKRTGTYYQFFSAWTRGYEIGVFTAESPLGPWKLTLESPIFGSRKRAFRELQMIDGGYSHITFDDTQDPYVETGHCAVFPGPDGSDWLCCHYFAEGTKPIVARLTIEYEDTCPQLGIEPLHLNNGVISVNGPTWTEQTVTW